MGMRGVVLGINAPVISSIAQLKFAVWIEETGAVECFAAPGLAPARVKVRWSAKKVTSPGLARLAGFEP